MAKRPITITPTEEAEYTMYAMSQLAEAWRTLEGFKRLCSKCAGDSAIQESLLRAVIVLYGSVFKRSHLGGGKERWLEQELYVPTEYRELHDRLIKYRDKLVAHFDFDVRKPELTHIEDGATYYKFADSPVLELRNNLPQIAELVKRVMAAIMTRHVSMPT